MYPILKIPEKKLAGFAGQKNPMYPKTYVPYKNARKTYVPRYIIGVIYAKFCEKLVITQIFPDHPLTDIIDIYLAPNPALRQKSTLRQPIS